MLRIAICDDLPQELQSLARLINQYLTERNLIAEVVAFGHADALLKAIEGERFHLYILDIVMPMVDGLELGKAIRRQDWEAQIIYATTESQFALQAYAASPINYLIKPITRQPLFETLSLAIARVDLNADRTFAIKTADGLRVVNFSDIFCCEYRDHKVIFKLTNDEDVHSRTIRANYTNYLAAILKDRHFLQCHAAFVVNMRRVERFAKDHFTLAGGKMVPIAAKHYPTVRDTYMDYLMARGVVG